jgi:hypothetical protein
MAHASIEGQKGMVGKRKPGKQADGNSIKISITTMWGALQGLQRRMQRIMANELMTLFPNLHSVQLPYRRRRYDL